MKKVEEKKTNYGLKNEKAIISFLDKNIAKNFALKEGTLGVAE
jgi:hypothetical protein